MLAAISERVAGELLFGVAAVPALCGFWLLVSSSARRRMLVERGGTELRPRARLDEVIDARLLRTEQGAILAARLRSAGTDLTATQFLGIVFAAALAAFVVANLLLAPLLAFVAAALAVWAGFVWLARRLDKRKEEFINQLPDVARLLSNGASAGLAMTAAIELAVREIELPARQELQTVLDEVHLGRSLDESLGALARRLPSREIGVLMTTLIIQQRAGGDAVRALQELSGTLENRRETLREVRTLMAGAVFTSYIVPLLGVGALLLLNTINSHTLQRMTTNTVGIIALVVAGSLYALGSLAIRRTTRIDV